MRPIGLHCSFVMMSGVAVMPRYGIGQRCVRSHTGRYGSADRCQRERSGDQ